MTPVLEFLIALLMAFILLSTRASSVQEFYSARVGKNTRSVMLYQALLKVFNDKSNRNFTDDIYRHPLIEKSKPDEKSLPAYIEDTVFATVLTDVLKIWETICLKIKGTYWFIGSFTWVLGGHSALVLT